MQSETLASGRVWLAGDPGTVPAPAPPSSTASLPDPPAAPVARVSPGAASDRNHLAPFTVDVGLDGWDVFPLTRDDVWLVPAVAQGLQVIAGTIGTLPPGLHRGRDPLPLPTFLAQPDPEEPRESTLTRLVEDLVLFPYAYLVVLERDRNGFPLHGRYVPAELVEPADPPLDPLGPPATAPTQYRIGVGSGLLVPAVDVLRFPSHWPGLLVVGRRSLRTAMLLESAAQRFATIDAPIGTLKNSGADLPPAKVDELLTLWENARRTRSTAYLNALLDYTPTSWNAEQIQLVDARRWQTAEVARLLNLPSSYLNAETEASLTYANIESRRRDLVDLSLRPYLAAVERRLTMDDVVPHGQTVAFDLDAFYRGDLAARGAYYAQALNGPQPWLEVDEVRSVEGLPEMTGGTANGESPPPP